MSKKDSGKVKMKYMDQTGGLASPFVIRPDAPLKYFQEPQSMLTLYMSMLSNPMLLMMFAVVALMTCMQYIDPDAMQELQKEVSGSKQQDKAPHQTLPSLIAKPKQGNKLSQQIAAAASGNKNAPIGSAIKTAFADEEDSDSQEDENKSD